MSREIKFRGKRKDKINDEWYFGFLIIEPNKSYWIDYYDEGKRRTVEVLPETVGQLSNQLTKKSGFEIYEGDTIEFDLAEGLGEPRTNNHCEKIKSIEGNYGFYINIILKK